MKPKGRTYAKFTFSLFAGFSYSCQIQCTSQDFRTVNAIKNVWIDFFFKKPDTEARGTNKLYPYSY